MKLALVPFFLGILLLFTPPARADVTLIEKIEGDPAQGDLVIKIKGDKVRVDTTPKVSAIFDGARGEIITLMNDQKTATRRPAGATVKKFDKEVAKPKLVATGQKETINGFETEQYVYDGPELKATYWIAPKYPNADDILKQLRAVKSQVWNSNGRLPDYTELPGLPIRTRLTTKQNGTQESSATITAVKLDPISDGEFAVPADFKEMKLP